MDYILDKYVSPHVFYDAGFSSLRLGGEGTVGRENFFGGF
jgi:hypothetical protein